jgi:hypothetical protein
MRLQIVILATVGVVLFDGKCFSRPKMFLEVQNIPRVLVLLEELFCNAFVLMRGWNKKSHTRNRKITCEIRGHDGYRNFGYLLEGYPGQRQCGWVAVDISKCQTHHVCS